MPWLFDQQNPKKQERVTPFRGNYKIFFMYLERNYSNLVAGKSQMKKMSLMSVYDSIISVLLVVVRRGVVYNTPFHADGPHLHLPVQNLERTTKIIMYLTMLEIRTALQHPTR